MNDIIWVASEFSKLKLSYVGATHDEQNEIIARLEHLKWMLSTRKCNDCVENELAGALLARIYSFIAIAIIDEY